MAAHASRASLYSARASLADSEIAGVLINLEKHRAAKLMRKKAAEPDLNEYIFFDSPELG